jgi:indolepyruvate ferredoxin oxidoreductase alpha subunit
MKVDETICMGEDGMRTLLYPRVPLSGLVWNETKKKAEIDQVICVGCGVCAMSVPSMPLRGGGGVTMTAHNIE